MASLFVVQGADRGKRFELPERPTALGRERSNPIRLHDNEVSRRHAEVRPDGDGYRIVDLGSANGTFVNGQLVEQAPLKRRRPRPDRRDGPRSSTPAPTRPRRPDRPRRPARPGQPRGPLGDPPERARPATGERLVDAPGVDRRVAEGPPGQPLGHVPGDPGHQPRDRPRRPAAADPPARLRLDRRRPRRDPPVRRRATAGRPKAVRWRGPADDPEERMRISRSIVDHVLTEGQGVITTDAPIDRRFGPSQSIVDYGIREAICVPVQGRHTTLGRPLRRRPGLARGRGREGPNRGRPKGKFTQEHLMLMVAIGHQAGLAIESTNFYQAKLEAERLAAVGQTIATPSHHIKNIMQGIKGGSYLVEMGLDQKDEDDHPPRLGDRREEPGEDLQPRHGHALLLEGPRAGPGAERPERGRRRRRRADASPGRRSWRVALDWQPVGRPADRADRPRRHPPGRPEHRDQRPRRRRGPARAPGRRLDRLGRRGAGRPGRRRGQRRRHPRGRPPGDLPGLRLDQGQPRAPASACRSPTRSSASTAAGSSSSRRPASAPASPSSCRCGPSRNGSTTPRGRWPTDPAVPGSIRGCGSRIEECKPFSRDDLQSAIRRPRQSDDLRERSGPAYESPVGPRRTRTASSRSARRRSSAQSGGTDSAAGVAGSSSGSGRPSRVDLDELHQAVHPVCRPAGQRRPPQRHDQLGPRAADLAAP